MHTEEFETWSRRVAEWGAHYRATLGERPVRPDVVPGSIFASVPQDVPEQGCGMDAIWEDFERIVLPGMTHWQHPRFFAYFPANAAPVSVVAEYAVTAMAAQCMLWQTSPAATELETRMMGWLRDAIGLPGAYHGVIQDSASSATLAAVLVMRERALNWRGNQQGLSGQGRLRIYCSTEVHSSIDRAIWIAGIGQDNLVKLPVDPNDPLRGMDVDALRRAIADDRAAGHIPAGVIAAFGGTSTGSTDPLAAVAAVARDEGLYSHLDAAWAGAAMICPEMRGPWAGAEAFDSVVFNPHKWLGASFDCSAHFLRDPEPLVKTLAIQPEYLKTHGADGIINYSEWSIPLGRRFRALKLWFLLRYHGLEGLRAMIRNHVRWTQDLCERLRAARFEIVTEPVLALFSFRHRDDARTLALIEAINRDGRIYLTQSRVDGALVIRFSAGSFAMQDTDVDIAFDVISELAAQVD